MAATISELASLERMRHSDAIVRASNASRAADAVALQAREDFYRALVDGHGARDSGKLTYDEIVELSGWSRNWVRLAISNFRKRQAAQR